MPSVRALWARCLGSGMPPAIFYISAAIWLRLALIEGSRDRLAFTSWSTHKLAFTLWSVDVI